MMIGKLTYNVRQLGMVSVLLPITYDLSLFFCRCVKLGYVERLANVSGMFLEADNALFRRIL